MKIFQQFLPLVVCLNYNESFPFFFSQFLNKLDHIT